MLRSESLFGKRETSTPNPSTSSTSTLGQNGGSSIAKASAGTPIGGIVNSTLATTTNTSPAMSSSNEQGNKLIVGPNIKLKGEITDCDTLVVEGKGRVEATIASRMVQIFEGGEFKGSAEVDIAEIHGEFDGELTARQKLVIYATGKVTGKVRYGKLVVAEGGQLAGDIQVNTSAAAGARNLSVAKTAP
jgi:cytoskeletal protein CcmA (bactofilin family)